jgi:hypothetical protein
VGSRWVIYLHLRLSRSQWAWRYELGGHLLVTSWRLRCYYKEARALGGNNQVVGGRLGSRRCGLEATQSKMVTDGTEEDERIQLEVLVDL